VRDDFTVTTGNKQLNFLQHIMTIAKQSAAVVLPDNVLFEGGAGETLRRKLLKDFDFHTLLRLPTGIWYSQGVKANVLFFDRAPASERVATQELWVYDFRTNQRFTLRERPLKRSDLDDFVKAYGAKNRRHERVETERFHRFTYDELEKRDKLNLDIFWLKDASATDPDSLPRPDEVAAEIVNSLELALEKFRSVAAKLQPTEQ
jgi:type I restriction enzyme M protein